MRHALLTLLVLAAPLLGCGEPTGPALVSAQSPPGTGNVNSASQPQPPNSLPPGATNVAPGVGTSQPTYLSRTFGTR